MAGTGADGSGRSVRVDRLHKGGMYMICLKIAHRESAANCAYMLSVKKRVYLAERLYNCSVEGYSIANSGIRVVCKGFV